MYHSHMYPMADGDTRCHRCGCPWHCSRAQYAGGTQSFVLNVEPHETPKHGSLMNVSGMREGERKRMRRERSGGGGENGIPRCKPRLIHYDVYPRPPSLLPNDARLVWCCTSTGRPHHCLGRSHRKL